MNQELYYGVTGQYLEHYADLVPTSASVTVHQAVDGDDASALAATTGSAAADAVATTVATAYDPATGDSTLLVVAATTNMVEGRRYLIAAATGEHETFELVKISTTLRMRHPLANAYPVGSTVKGLLIRIAIDGTWIADTGNLSYTDSPHPRYRARYQYTAGSVTVVRAEYFDVVRYSSAHGVTGLDVDAAHNGFLDMLPSRDRIDQGRRMIGAAAREVADDLAADEHGTPYLRDGSVRRALVIEKANEMLLRARFEQGASSEVALDSARAGYTTRYKQLVRSPGTRWDTDGSGAGNVGRKAPLFRR